MDTKVEGFSEAFLVSAARRLKHGPPFEAAELAEIKIFRLDDDPRPAGLECLTKLGQLSLVGCEAVDFEILRPLRRLWSLTCWGSNITSVQLLPQVAPRLKLLEVIVGQLRDLRPLLDLPLERVKLAGNPIDEESFRIVYPELIRRGAVRVDAAAANYLIHEREWELMQRFVARGLRLSAFQADGRTRITAPGQIVYASPHGMLEEISVRQAGRILDENPGIDERGFLEEARRIKGSDGYVE